MVQGGVARRHRSRGSFSRRRGAHRALARLIPIWSREHFRRFDPWTPDFSTRTPRASGTLFCRQNAKIVGSWLRFAFE